MGAAAPAPPVGAHASAPGTLYARNRGAGRSAGVDVGAPWPGAPLRLVAFDQIRPEGLALDVPITVSVGRDWARLWAPWREQLWCAVLLWCASTLLAAALLARRQRRQRQQRLLVQRERTLEAEFQARWLAVQEATGQGAWDYDLVSARMYYSPLWKSALGYDERDIGEGLDEWMRRVHPEDRARVEREWSEHLAGRTPDYESVHRIRRKDGRYQWTLDRGRVIARDGAGRALRAVGSKADMSERQQLQERLDRLVESVPGMLYQFQREADGRSHFPYASVRAHDIVGLAPEELARDAAPAFARIHPRDLEMVERHIAESASRLDVWRAEFRIHLPGRGERWLNGQAMPQRLHGGAVLWQGYLHDVTESKQRDFKLAATEKLLRRLMEQMPIGLCMVDETGAFYFRNRRFAEYFGYADDEELTLERWWREAYPDPDYRAQVLETWDAAMAYAHEHGGEIPDNEYRVHTRYASQRTMSIGGIAFQGHFMAAFTDQTEERVRSDQLRQMAFADALTGVANRRQFDAALSTEWSRCQRGGEPLALVLLDIDGFKDYNDRYGHQMGDDCLAAVAQALASVAGRGHDLLARYGGEEFVCLLPGCDGAGARARAEQLCQAVRRLERTHAGSPHRVVTVSAGVASALPAGGGDAEPGVQALVACADAQLYRAKQAGRNRICGGEE